MIVLGGGGREIGGQGIDILRDDGLESLKNYWVVQTPLEAIDRISLSKDDGS